MTRKANQDGLLRVKTDSPTVRELTADKIREAILSQHFKPGDKLIDRELCAQTGVSRTSLREALRHLEAEGLVEHIANRGLFVTTVSADEARQIYEVRGALEAAAGYKFAERAGEQDIKDLMNALLQLEATVNKGSIKNYVEALDHIYLVLLRGSRNEVARHLLGTLRARINYLRTMTSERQSDARRQETIGLMRELVSAAERRDGPELARRCAAFAERSAAFALETFRGAPDPR